MYPGGLWNTPRPEAYFLGRPDNAYGVYPNGVQHLSPDFALGAVLQQEEDDGKTHVIAYGRRSLAGPERRYCVTRKEMLAVIFGLKKYRQHLLGRKFLVRTDHAALAYLKRTPEPIGQQGLWLDFLSEFDCEIVHRPGSSHSNSDALSRRPCEPEGAEPCPQCVKGTTARGGAGRRVQGCPGFEGELADPVTSSSEATSSQSESEDYDEYEVELSDGGGGESGQLDSPWESTSVSVHTTQQGSQLGRLIRPLDRAVRLLNLWSSYSTILISS